MAKAFTHCRPVRAAGWVLLAGVLLSGAGESLAAPGASAVRPITEHFGPLVVARPGATMTNLLAPVKELLSGRAWLMAEGLDPGLLRRPGWDPLTRLDWRALNDAFAGAPGLAAGASPVLQAPGGALAVPFRSPAPAFSRNLLVTRDFGQVPIQTEPHLAVNPDDPDHLVVGVIDYNFPTVVSYVSIDGGATWEGPFQVPYAVDDRVSGGDPVLAFDRRGNVYFASISIGVEDFSVGPLFLSDLVSSITVSRSEDGGFTWPETISTARSRISVQDQQLDPTGRLRGRVRIGFLDKPWMAIGPHPRDPERDVIYVSYTDFDTVYEIRWIGEIPALVPRELVTTIRVVASQDGGRSWSEPVAVSPTVRRAFGEPQQPADVPGRLGVNRVVQGSYLTVAPDGTVYVAWLDTTDDGSMEGLAEIHVARSTDGGKTFSRPVIAAAFNELSFRPRTAFFRHWGSAFPRMAAGPSKELYLVFAARPPDRPRDEGDIYFVRSEDGGETWTRPVRLNDDDGDNLQFFPALDVSADGTVHVMWGDMRDDPRQARYHIYYTRSEDGGRTWGFELKELNLQVRDTRVTDFPSNPNRGFPFGLFIGDYFAVAAAEDDVYMVWADTRLGEFGGTNQKIGFARRRAVRSPGIFVSPPAGAGGQSITLQGFDFQPDMNVFVQLGDATIASARTNQEGRFTTGLFIPVTGKGAQTLRVIDESGNMATTSFYTEFGFDSLQELYSNLQGQVEQLQKVLNDLDSRRPPTGEGAP